MGIGSKCQVTIPFSLFILSLNLHTRVARNQIRFLTKYILAKAMLFWLGVCKVNPEKESDERDE